MAVDQDDRGPDLQVDSGAPDPLDDVQYDEGGKAERPRNGLVQ